MYSVADRLTSVQNNHYDAPLAVVQFVIGDSSWECRPDDPRTGEVVVNTRILSDPEACRRVLGAIFGFAFSRDWMAAEEAAPADQDDTPATSAA